MRWLLFLSVVLVPRVAVAQIATQAAADCERLASISLPRATITIAQS